MPFCGSFMIRVEFHWVIQLGICFFLASINFDYQCVMDRCEYLKPESMYALIAECSFNLALFWVLLWDTRCVPSSLDLLWTLLFFSYGLYIYLFSHGHFVFIFCTTIMFPCHSIAGMSPCIFRLADWINIYFFVMFHFVCIMWSYLSIFLVFPLPPVTSDLLPRVVLFVLIVV